MLFVLTTCDSLHEKPVFPHAMILVYLGKFEFAFILSLLKQET